MTHAEAITIAVRCIRAELKRIERGKKVAHLTVTDKRQPRYRQAIRILEEERWSWIESG